MLQNILCKRKNMSVCICVKIQSARSVIRTSTSFPLALHRCPFARAHYYVLYYINNLYKCIINLTRLTLDIVIIWTMVLHA